MAQKTSNPGLCLVARARAGADWQARLGTALDATSAVTLILTAPEDGPIDAAVARPLVELAQQKKIAALLADDVATARAVGADGVHLAWRPEIEDAFETARTALGPDAIVGAEAGISRHDAMMLGESGADYVAFAAMTDTYPTDEAREAQHDLVAWWVEIFLLPCVAFGATTPDEVAEFVRAGADFVAVSLPLEFPGAAAEKKWADDIVAALTAPANTA